MSVINLRKNGVINLKKEDGSSLNFVSLGLSWDSIPGAPGKKTLFNRNPSPGRPQAVDLDASAVTFDSQGNQKNLCSWQKLRLGDYIIHSGDDRSGSDSRGIQDNETIGVDLSKVPLDVETVVFTVNAYDNTSFHLIPNVRVRVYEGTDPPITNDGALGLFNVSSDESYRNQKSMIMGKVSRRNGSWNFTALGNIVSGHEFTATAAAAGRMLKSGAI